MIEKTVGVEASSHINIAPANPGYGCNIKVRAAKANTTTKRSSHNVFSAFQCDELSLFSSVLVLPPCSAPLLVVVRVRSFGHLEGIAVSDKCTSAPLEAHYEICPHCSSSTAFDPGDSRKTHLVVS